MRRRLEAAAGPRAEQGAMAELTGTEPTGDYLGASAVIVDDVLARAAAALERTAP